MKYITPSIFLLVITLASSVVGKQCKNPTVRKEIRELTKDELNRFTSAINKLHATPRPGTNISEHEYFSKIHYDYKVFAHKAPAFLPWHRYFIRDYEKALQKIDPKVTLPYWDWSLDSQEPHKSPILSTEYFGGNGNAYKDHCLTDGPFLGWQMNYPTPHCLRRDFDRGDKVTPLSYPEELTMYLNEPKFSDFSLMFEEKHGFPHLFIGGPKGDFLPIWSPNDPIFFIHHAFVDYIWFQWQQMHPNSMQYEGDRYKQPVSASNIMKPYDDTFVESTFDTEDEHYCYTYEVGYPRVIYPEGTSSSAKARVENSIKNNVVFNGDLKGKTMSEALEYLRDKIFDLRLNQALKPSNSPKIEPTGLFSNKWIKALNFSLNDEARPNSDDSTFFAYLLNDLPDFTSVAHFRHLLKETRK